MDWGLVGAGLFLAFVVSLCQPLLAEAWRGRLMVPWSVAVAASLAAFGTHGLVDFFLNNSAVFVSFWLICGLAFAIGSNRVADQPQHSTQVWNA